MLPDSASARPEFVGRDSELRQLTDALRDPQIRLVLLVAPTGLGKSSLVNHWIRTLSPEDAVGVTRVFARSLFADDPQVRPHAWLEAVVEDACRFFGLADIPTSGQLAQAIRNQKSLVILDGVDGCLATERQHCHAATVLAGLIRGLVDENPGVTILTMQSICPSIQNLPATRIIRLGALSTEDGAEVLVNQGVHAGKVTCEVEERHLRQAVKECGGHPVLISLLGRYLTHVHDGDIHHKREAWPASAKQFDVQLRYLLRAFTDWLRDGPELALVRLLAFSAEPLFLEELLEISQHTAVSHIAESLKGQSRDGLVWAAKTLQDCGLVKIRPDHRLISSQLVRQHMRAELRAQNRLPALTHSSITPAPRI